MEKELTQQARSSVEGSGQQARAFLTCLGDRDLSLRVAQRSLL